MIKLQKAPKKEPGSENGGQPVTEEAALGPEEILEMTRANRKWGHKRPRGVNTPTPRRSKRGAGVLP